MEGKRLLYNKIMTRIYLRKIKESDLDCFSKWWRDDELLTLTSGVTDKISDMEVEKYFLTMKNSKSDLNFMITANSRPVGHISLNKRPNGDYETQIIIGEKENWSKGIGAEAIKQLIKKAKALKIKDIFLEVRPDNLRAINAYKKAGFREVGLKKYPNNLNLKEVIVMEYCQD